VAKGIAKSAGKKNPDNLERRRDLIALAKNYLVAGAAAVSFLVVSAVIAAAAAAESAAA